VSLSFQSPEKKPSVAHVFCAFDDAFDVLNRRYQALDLLFSKFGLLGVSVNRTLFCVPDSLRQQLLRTPLFSPADERVRTVGANYRLDQYNHNLDDVMSAALLCDGARAIDTLLIAAGSPATYGQEDAILEKARDIKQAGMRLVLISNVLGHQRITDTAAHQAFFLRKVAAEAGGVFLPFKYRQQQEIVDMFHVAGAVIGWAHPAARNLALSSVRSPKGQEMAHACVRAFNPRCRTKKLSAPIPLRASQGPGGTR
jgi:hypothetical protein